MIPGDFAQRHIHRLNRVRGVDHFPDLFRVAEQRDDARPMRAPGFADGRILLVPFLGKQLQIELRFSLRRRRVNRFQVFCDLRTLFVIDVFQRIADHVDQAQLDLGLREDGFDGFWEAGQTIHTGDVAVFHPPVAQLCTDCKPKFRALALARSTSPTGPCGLPCSLPAKGATALLMIR